MDRQISLIYKEPIKAKFFVLLIILLLLTGVTVIIFFPSQAKPYQSSPFHSSTPKWLYIFSYTIVILLISLFLINKFGYGFFIYSKIKLIRREYGLPIDINKFVEISGVTKDWLEERKIYISNNIDKRQLAKIIRMYNYESEDIFKKIGGWYWSLVDSIFESINDFIFKKR